MTEDASTRFPFLNLEKALGRALVLFDGDPAGKPMPVATAFELWGYSPKSSGGFQTVSALKGYGLIDDDGANADRKVRLTEQARRYFLDERDEVRSRMLHDFALNPPLFRALWVNDKWHSGVPADPIARSHLKIDRKLNDQSARALLGIFKENINFAQLKPSFMETHSLESDAMAFVAKAAGKPEPEPAIGVPMEQVQAKETIVAAAVPGKPDVRIVGDRVVIHADLDVKGLRKLGRQIKVLESFLTLGDEEEDEEVEHDDTSFGN